MNFYPKWESLRDLGEIFTRGDQKFQCQLEDIQNESKIDLQFYMNGGVPNREFSHCNDIVTWNSYDVKKQTLHFSCLVILYFRGMYMCVNFIITQFKGLETLKLDKHDVVLRGLRHRAGHKL